MVELAETYGVLQGLLMAFEEGWNRFYCETDAKNVADSLIKQDYQAVHWLAIGSVKEILKLKDAFQEVHFSWCPRENKFLAHFVCNWCMSNNINGYVLLDCMPSVFQFFVEEEQDSQACSHQ